MERKLYSVWGPLYNETHNYDPPPSPVGRGKMSQVWLTRGIPNSVILYY